MGAVLSLPICTQDPFHSQAEALDHYLDPITRRMTLSHYIPSGPPTSPTASFTWVAHKSKEQTPDTLVPTLLRTAYENRTASALRGSRLNGCDFGGATKGIRGTRLSETQGCVEELERHLTA